MTCETNGHLYGRRGCLFCGAEPGTSTPLLELRAMAIKALDHPVDARVPRSERDLVVPAEVLIELIDHYVANDKPVKP